MFGVIVYITQISASMFKQIQFFALSLFIRKWIP